MSGRCPTIGGDQGQNDRDRRSLPDLAGNVDAAAVILHDLVADGQPQTGADTDAFGRVSRIEDAAQRLLGDPGARIRNGNVYVPTNDPCAHGDRSCLVDGLLGVVEDVEKDLIQPARVTQDLGDLAVIAHDVNTILRIVVDQHQRVVEALMQVRLLALGLIKSGEVAQAAHDRRHPRRTGLDDPVGIVNDLQCPGQGTALAAALGVLLLDGGLQLAHSPHERVVHAVDGTDGGVDLVGDARHQIAQGGHLV